MDPAVLDEIQRIFRAARFVSDLGIELESVGDGECVTTLEIEDRHLQQDGYVHAGVDVCSGLRTAGRLDEEKLVRFVRILDAVGDASAV